MMDTESDAVYATSFCETSLVYGSSSLETVAQWKYGDFLKAHLPRLKAAEVPQCLYRKLYDKVKRGRFDINRVLCSYGTNGDFSEPIVVLRSCGEADGSEVLAANSDIFLVPHVWTAGTMSALSCEHLFPYVSKACPDSSFFDKLNWGNQQEAKAQFWRWAMPIYTWNHHMYWYLLNSVGLFCQRSDEPNFVFKPLYLSDDPCRSFTLAWPCRDVRVGEPIIRNIDDGRVSHIPGVCPDARVAKVMRSAMLAQSRTLHFNSDIILEHVAESLSGDVADSRRLSLLERCEGIHYKAPGAPKKISRDDGVEPLKTLKVYSDSSTLLSALADMDGYIPCNTIEDADVVWPITNLRGWELLQPDTIVGQFPGHQCITTKDALTRTVYDTLGRKVSWLMETYDTTSCHGLRSLVERLRKSKEVWIVKPANLARSKGIVVTSDALVILRLVETVACIVQKYIERPLLYQRRKFDLRFFLLLKSIDPLEVHVHPLVIARVANNEYKMDADSFTDMETHTTVMQYAYSRNGSSASSTEGCTVEAIISDLEQSRSDFRWKDVLNRVLSIAREMFLCAEKHKYPQGFLQRDSSRMILGLDIMLSDSMDVYVLEVNFSPDTRRAMEEYPSFWKDIFRILVEGDENLISACRSV